jgi:hypothetical protein
LIPTADVIRIGRAVANALDYAHSQQIIHRDVKPSNVLVARDGRVMLSDFGLALDMHDGSEGEVFGTAHYISPEQARRSADAVPQSDLYSLGVILYEMLTGVVPFHDPSPASVALQHITEPPPAPRSINPELSAQAEAVLLKALEKEPDKRYQGGDELMDALEAALTAVPFADLPPLPPLPVDVPTLRRRTLSHNTVDEIVSGVVTPEAEPTLRSTGTVQRELSNRAAPLDFLKRFSPWWLAGAAAFLCVIAILGLYLFRNVLFHNLPAAEPASSPTAAGVAPPPAVTVTPARTESAPTLQVTLLPTAIPASPTPTLLLAPTVEYPEGFLFKMVYNDKLFYIINLSKVTRSVSAFSFEKIDEQGQVLKHFDGWLWEAFYPNLSPRHCMGVTTSNEPSELRPDECGGRFASLLYYQRENAAVFWTEPENGRQFRVLWKGREAARCEIEAGVCEVLMP